MGEPLLLGIRHHGPGSARAVLRALDEFGPEVVLIEGPPEADALVPLVAAEGMRPPVALLAYKATASVFWPFAEFSPEWQALRWAVAHDVPVRFMDLPAGARGLWEEPAEQPGATEGAEHIDPIGELAAAAGYDDPERWWEDVVEHRRGAPSPSTEGEAEPAPQHRSSHAINAFAAIAAAMAEVRRGVPPENLNEQRREAHMRTVLRAATKHFERVAVVCGAFHVPALTAPLPAASADAAILKGLPKTRITMTWVPWTYGRLASAHGYGAGVTSPGWYDHLFASADEPIARWFVLVAGLLREEGIPVSSAHLIEATRLAQALATLRGRPLAGLHEVTEATLAVLCDGDPVRLHLVQRKLVIGERLGEVPADTPTVPLAADVAAAQKRLRMTVSPLQSELAIDLRTPTGPERSHLLHRLRLLGIGWGSLAERRGQGTFWEDWVLLWRPEFAVDLIAASTYGATVAQAATAKVVEVSAQAGLAQLTNLVHRCLLADLPDALAPVLRRLADTVALDADVAHLMEALPPLARTLRYGDVRGTDLGPVRAIAHGLVVRVCVGLPGALAGLDDDAATAMRDRLDAVDEAVALIDDAGLIDEWRTTLARVAGRDDLPGLLAGRLTRLLLDCGRLSAEEAGRAAALALTVGVPPTRAAAWVEGFLAGSGLLLVHDTTLLSLVDDWLAGIPGETFLEVLPLLRRTFSTFPAPQRRAIGEKVRRGATATPAGSTLDEDRAALVLPTVRLLLGVS